MFISMHHSSFSEFSRIRLTSLVSIIALAVVSPVAATVFTWDPSGATGVQAGDGTWNTSLSNWTTDGGETHVPWVDGVHLTGASSAVFAGSDAGGVITLTGNRTIAVAGSSLQFLNSGYTLQSDGGIVRTLSFINNTVLLIASGKSVTIGSNVTVSGGFIGGSTSGIANGTLILEAGSKFTAGGVTSILGVGTQVNVKTGASLASSGTIILGSGTGDNTSLVVDGGSVSTAGTGNLALNNGASMANASSSVALNSGSITLTGSSARVLLGGGNNATVANTFNLNGGTITTSGVTDTTASVSTFNFNGGILKAGAVSNGLIVATAGNFMDALNNAVVKAGGAKVDSNGSDIKIAAALTHDTLLGGTVDGGFEKLGAGSVTLSGINTYTGLTKVTAGELISTATSTFGTGNILVLGGATLTLGNADSIHEAALLTFNSTSVINLNFIDGAMAVAGVLLSGSESISSGIYTATQLNEHFGFGSGSEVFFGSGSVSVTAVPEPSAWALVTGMLGLAHVVSARLKRRRAALL